MSEILEDLRFAVDLLGVIGVCDNESIPNTLIGLTDQKTLVELSIEEIAVIFFQSAFACPAVLREFASINGIFDSFYSKAGFLSVFELSVIANCPLSFSLIVIFYATSAM